MRPVKSSGCGGGTTAYAIHVLDCRHAREHRWAVAHALHGQESPAARDWVESLLHQLRHGQEEQVVRTLAALLERNSGLTRQAKAAVRPEVEYVQTHREQTHDRKSR